MRKLDGFNTFCEVNPKIKGIKRSYRGHQKIIRFNLFSEIKKKPRGLDFTVDEVTIKHTFHFYQPFLLNFSQKCARDGQKLKFAMNKI